MRVMCSVCNDNEAIHVSDNIYLCDDDMCVCKIGPPERVREMDFRIRAEDIKKLILTPAQVTRAELSRLLALGHISKERITEEHGQTCYLCGRKVSIRTAHIDHVIAIRHNGTNDIENLRLVHSRCNLRKGGRLIETLHDAKKIMKRL